MVGRNSPPPPLLRLVPPGARPPTTASTASASKRRGSGRDCAGQHPGVVGWLVGCWLDSCWTAGATVGVDSPSATLCAVVLWWLGRPVGWPTVGAIPSLLVFGSWSVRRWACLLRRPILAVVGEVGKWCIKPRTWGLFWELLVPSVECTTKGRGPNTQTRPHPKREAKYAQSNWGKDLRSTGLRHTPPGGLEVSSPIDTGKRRAGSAARAVACVLDSWHCTGKVQQACLCTFAFARGWDLRSASLLSS